MRSRVARAVSRARVLTVVLGGIAGAAITYTIEHNLLGLGAGLALTLAEAGGRGLWRALDDWAARGRTGDGQEAETFRDAQEADYARRQLLAQSHVWVNDGPEPAPPPGLLPIKLRLAERLAAVDHPRRPPGHRHRPLPPTTPVVEFFRRFDERLLILGEPGAGKSTLLTQIAGDLLTEADANPTRPVPMVFGLTSWATDQLPLADWLAAVTSDRCRLPLRLARGLVLTHQVAPLLDGLDQVAEGQRAACLRAINQYREEQPALPLVVCSRLREYEDLGILLQVNGAVVVEPLRREEVVGHLHRAGEPLAGVLAALGRDQQLSELVTTPLLLTIVALTYQDNPGLELELGGSLVENRNQVLSRYIEVMLGRQRARSPRYPPDAVRQWLTWLARTLRATNRNLFYLDRLQPELLDSRRDRRAVLLEVALAAAVIEGATMVLIAGVALGIAVSADPGASPAPLPFADLQPRLGIALLAAVLAAATLGMAVYERGVEATRWSWSVLKRSWWWHGLVGGLCGGVAWLIVAASHLAGQTGASGLVLLGGVPIGIGIGLSYSVFTASQELAGRTPSSPGDDLRTLRWSALVSGLGGALALGAGTGVSIWFGLQLFGSPSPWAGVLAAALTAPLAGFAIAMTGGLGAYLRHQAIVFRLARAGCMPRRPGRFLEYADDVNLLRRRGGGYEFVHPLLLQYLAGPAPTRPADPPLPAPASAEVQPSLASGDTHPSAGP